MSLSQSFINKMVGVKPFSVYWVSVCHSFSLSCTL
uniref:Uncharacterized protein n=1 Tax=Anguilla anguilla TaxID=7936 RepID=A0A0E9QVK0_ANGAN